MLPGHLHPELLYFMFDFFLSVIRGLVFFEEGEVIGVVRLTAGRVGHGDELEGLLVHVVGVGVNVELIPLRN